MRIPRPLPPTLPEWHRGRTDAPMVLGPCQWDSVHIVNTLCEGSGRPYQDRAVVVAIGVAPAGAHQAVDEVPLVRARDDDRHSPVGEGLLPARASRVDPVDRIPHVVREELDPGIDGNRRLREGELEP